jgi:tetratricopeptide (TPR) repeat protein
MIAIERGDHQEAGRAFRRALELAREIGDWGEETEALFELGVNALRAGDPAGALEFLDRTAARVEDHDYHRWILLLPQHRGDALLALGDLAGAAELYRRVLASEERSEAVVRARAAYGLARVALAGNTSDHATARTHLHEALGILTEAELPSLERTLTTALADIERETPARGGGTDAARASRG